MTRSFTALVIPLLKETLPIPQRVALTSPMQRSPRLSILILKPRMTKGFLDRYCSFFRKSHGPTTWLMSIGTRIITNMMKLALERRLPLKHQETHIPIIIRRRVRV